MLTLGWEIGFPVGWVTEDLSPLQDFYFPWAGDVSFGVFWFRIASCQLPDSALDQPGEVAQPSYLQVAMWKADSARRHVWQSKPLISVQVTIPGLVVRHGTLVMLLLSRAC